MFNNLDLAYLGGLLDGEGCIQFQIGKPKRANGRQGVNFTPRITLGNTNPIIMDNAIRIIEDIGVGFNVQNFSESPRRKAAKVIGIVGYKRCFRFLSVVEPYLVGKKESSRIVRAFCWSRFKLGSRYGHIKYSDEEVSLVNLIKYLNHRGEQLEILNEHTIESARKYTDMMCSELHTKDAEYRRNGDTDYQI